MPFLIPDYKPPLLFRDGHLGSILPYFFRPKFKVPYQRERIPTHDYDFLDIDWLRTGHSRCAILVHGLEGSSQSSYILSLALFLQKNGWNVAALNLRGCSGEPNKLYRSYHSGATDDLKTTIDHVSKSHSEIAIIGFSLGGNIVLKYTGDSAHSIPKQIKAVVGVSVPCHLSSSSDKMERWDNLLYSYQFLFSLKAKLRTKMQLFPNTLSPEKYLKIKTIRLFDDMFTGPANGFADGEDYYKNCSSKQVISKIQVSTLIINALDDPFLTDKCFPRKEAETNPKVHLYMPNFGGHVGFWPETNAPTPKHEEWILSFLAENNCS